LPVCRSSIGDNRLGEIHISSKKALVVSKMGAYYLESLCLSSFGGFSNFQHLAATNSGNENGSEVVVASSLIIADDSKQLQPLEREVTSDDGYPLPTAEESKTLRKVAGSLPLVSFALCLVEFAERASYYGAKTVFSNFIQFPLPEGMYLSNGVFRKYANAAEGGNGAGAPPRGTQKTAGALGMGLQASSGLTLLFIFLSYVIPIFGGWWADVHIGRYKAICVGVLICGVAHVIQVFGAIPSVLQKGTAHGAPPFIIGLLLLAFGAGIFKPNVSPLILDQNPHKKAYTKTLKSGEKVIVDPEATTNRIMLLFYGFVNIGAFFMLATTYSEKYVGFWLSFLLAGLIYLLLPILLLIMYKRTYKRPPAGSSEVSQAFKIIGTALRQSNFQFWHKDFWDRATSSSLQKKGIVVGWTDKAVKDVSRTVGMLNSLLIQPHSPDLHYSGPFIFLVIF
jgi:MFS family permease